MRRLFLFLGALRWGARLQMLVVVYILACWLRVDIDIGRLPVAIAIIVISWLIGWLLIPVMLARPRLTFRILNWISYVILLISIFANLSNLVNLQNWFWWWNIRAAHYGRELAMWLVLSCEYWLVSEIRLLGERKNQQMNDSEDVSDFERDRDRDDFANDGFAGENASSRRNER